MLIFFDIKNIIYQENPIMLFNKLVCFNPKIIYYLYTPNNNKKLK